MTLEIKNYITDYNFIKFIQERSKMEWNDICDLIYDSNIVAYGTNISTWTKEEIENNNEELNKEQLQWIGAIFKEHPELSEISIVFDN